VDVSMKKEVLIIVVIAIALIGSVFGYTLTQKLMVEVLPEVINISQPLDGNVYADSYVPINLSLFGTKSEYLKYSADGGKFVKLCEGCSQYSGNKKFSEGKHSVTFTSLFGPGPIFSTVEFIVDSFKPKIIDTFPKRNSVINGTLFFVKYDEENLQNITLFYQIEDKVFERTNYFCDSGKNKNCTFENIYLSNYNNGKYLTYWFEADDYVHSILSRKVELLVDTTVPELEVSFSYDPKSKGIIYFNITSSEKADLSFMDLSDPKARWKTLCTDCNEYGSNKAKFKYFNKGSHWIVIKAIDQAGNSQEATLSFDIPFK
jgi:hypothetical protein